LIVSGTGIKVCVSHGTPSNIVDKVVIPTTTPAETLPKICAWWVKQALKYRKIHQKSTYFDRFHRLF
jgi:hypothetical protein